MDGVLVVDKPVGPTSHDVVARVRRALGDPRAGHTGTLDPSASGVLPLVLGRATRLARFLSARDKRYEAVIRLGWSTDTGDALGAPTGGGTAELPGADRIEAALHAFRGTFLQQPPAYSAKKIDGRRSYALARARADPRPPPVWVTAREIELLSAEADLVTVRLTCSAGFYVRSLASDVGTRLGTGGHLAALRRVESAGYTLSDALPLDAIERDVDAARKAIIPLARLLPDLPWVVLTPRGAARAGHGRVLGLEDLAARGGPTMAGSWMRLLDGGGELLGLARVTGDAELLHPSVVLR